MKKPTCTFSLGYARHTMCKSFFFIHTSRKRKFLNNGISKISLSNLQVRRTGIKSKTGAIFYRIGLFAMELFALSAENFSFRLIIKKMVSPR